MGWRLLGACLDNLLCWQAESLFIEEAPPHRAPPPHSTPPSSSHRDPDIVLGASLHALYPAFGLPSTPPPTATTNSPAGQGPSTSSSAPGVAQPTQPGVPRPSAPVPHPPSTPQHPHPPPPSLLNSRPSSGHILAGPSASSAASGSAAAGGSLLQAQAQHRRGLPLSLPRLLRCYATSPTDSDTDPATTAATATTATVSNSGLSITGRSNAVGPGPLPANSSPASTSTAAAVASALGASPEAHEHAGGQGQAVGPAAAPPTAPLPLPPTAGPLGVRKWAVGCEVRLSLWDVQMEQWEQLFVKAPVGQEPRVGHGRQPSLGHMGSASPVFRP